MINSKAEQKEMALQLQGICTRFLLYLRQVNCCNKETQKYILAQTKQRFLSLMTVQDKGTSWCDVPSHAVVCDPVWWTLFQFQPKWRQAVECHHIRHFYNPALKVSSITSTFNCLGIISPGQIQLKWSLDLQFLCVFRKKTKIWILVISCHNT